MAGCEALGLTPDTGTVPRLLAYARSVAGFPTAVKEVRNTAASAAHACVMSFSSLSLVPLSLPLTH